MAAPPATVDVSSGSEAPQRLFPPRSRCATFSSPAWGTASLPAKVIPIGRSRSPTRALLPALSGTAAAQYYRPSRAGYGRRGRACEAPDFLPVWQKHAALQSNSACHRSPYSYQTRAALALRCVIRTSQDSSAARLHRRLDHRRLSACSARGNACRRNPPTPARARSVANSPNCARPSPPPAKRRQPERQLDLVLLSIGANDIYFSGLVADVIVDTATERVSCSDAAE